MRVVAGDYKGRTLKAPAGKHTRPTLDRVKESLMSKVISARGSLDDARVLDAYAGSGALGIEALSRGAAYALFCDISAEAVRVVTENLTQLNVDSSRWKVCCCNVSSIETMTLEKPFNLVFLDPPYKFSPVNVLSLMETLYEKGVLSDDVLLCYELSKTSKPTLIEALNTLKWADVSSKDYGETSLVLLRKEA